MATLRGKKITLDKAVLRELTASEARLVGGATVGCQSLNPGDFLTCAPSIRRCGPNTDRCDMPTDRCAGESVRCLPTEFCNRTLNCTGFTVTSCMTQPTKP